MQVKTLRRTDHCRCKNIGYGKKCIRSAVRIQKSAHRCISHLIAYFRQLHDPLLRDHDLRVTKCIHKSFLTSSCIFEVSRSVDQRDLTSSIWQKIFRCKFCSSGVINTDIWVIRMVIIFTALYQRSDHSYLIQALFRNTIQKNHACCIHSPQKIAEIQQIPFIQMWFMDQQMASMCLCRYSRTPDDLLIKYILDSRNVQNDQRLCLLRNCDCIFYLTAQRTHCFLYPSYRRLFYQFSVIQDSRYRCRWYLCFLSN